VATIRLNRPSIAMSIGSVGVSFTYKLYLKAYCMYRSVKEGSRCLIQPVGGKRQLPSPRTNGHRRNANERRYRELPDVISDVRAVRIRDHCSCSCFPALAFFGFIRSPEGRASALSTSSDSWRLCLLRGHWGNIRVGMIGPKVPKYRRGPSRCETPCKQTGPGDAGHSRGRQRLNLRPSGSPIIPHSLSRELFKLGSRCP
jgi:hypothetical protein